jgi:cytochrome b561
MHAEAFKTILWFVLGVHVAAALVHQFYWKTDVMDRMTKGVKD